MRYRWMLAFLMGVLAMMPQRSKATCTGAWTLISAGGGGYTSNPTLITYVNNEIFFDYNTATGPNYNRVVRCSYSGSNCSYVASTEDTQVATISNDGTYAYWTAGRKVRKYDGSNPVTVWDDATSGPGIDYAIGLVLDGSYAYITATDADNHRVLKINMDTLGYTALFTTDNGTDPGGRIAFDSTNSRAYFTNLGTNPTVTAVTSNGSSNYAVSSGGASGIDANAGVATNGVYVWWAQGSYIKCAPYSGGTPRTLVSGLTTARAVHFDYNDLGNGPVIWFDDYGAGVVYGIPAVCPDSNPPSPTTVSSSQDSPWGLSFDDDEVYWVNSASTQAICKTTKPTSL